MITDIDKMSFNEVRSSLVLAKELLRGLTERAPDDMCFRSYSAAYIAVSDAISSFTRVQTISPDDNIFEVAASVARKKSWIGIEEDLEYQKEVSAGIYSGSIPDP